MPPYVAITPSKLALMVLSGPVAKIEAGELLR
jgi:hypothetical protein